MKMRAFVAIGADEQALAFAGARGDGGDRQPGKQLIVDLRTKGEVLVAVARKSCWMAMSESRWRGFRLGDLSRFVRPGSAVAFGPRSSVDLRPDALGASALGDHLVEERLGRGNAHEDVREFGAGGFAPDGDAARIAAEGGNIVLDPFERGDEVAEGVVGGAAVFSAE